MRAASWIAPTIAFLALTAFYVFFRIEMLDEGWYLQAGRLAWRGELPYRDFAYFQAPLLPYLYGASQQWSAGLLAGRFLAAAFALGTWALTILSARRLGGSRAALTAGCAFLASFYLYSHYPIVLTYAPAAFFLTAAVFARLRGASALPVLLAGIAAGIRFSLLPAMLVFAFVGLRDSNPSAPRRVGLALLAVGALLAFFVAPDPSLARFNILEYHVAGATVSDRLLAAARSLAELLATAGIVVVAALLAPFAAASTPHVRTLTAVLAACLAANLVPATTAPYYQSVLLPLLAILAAVTLARIRPALVTSLLVVQAVLQFEPARRLRIAEFAPDDRPLPFAERLSRLRDVARDLRAVTTPESRIFSLATYIAIEADRDVMPGLEMSIFSVQFDASREICERTHTVNPEMVRDWFAAGVPDVVLLTSWELEYFGGGSGPILQPLREHYAIRKNYERVGQFDGNAFLLTRLRPNEK